MENLNIQSVNEIFLPTPIFSFWAKIIFILKELHLFKYLDMT